MNYFIWYYNQRYNKIALKHNPSKRKRTDTACITASTTTILDIRCIQVGGRIGEWGEIYDSTRIHLLKQQIAGDHSSSYVNIFYILDGEQSVKYVFPLPLGIHHVQTQERTIRIRGFPRTRSLIRKHFIDCI